MIAPSPARSLESLRLAVFTDTYAPQVNGVARTLARLVDAVRERGGAVQVYAVDETARDLNGVRTFEGRAFPKYPQLRLAWPPARTVSQHLSEFAPTLVHVATEFGMGLAGRRAARRLEVPLVTSYHTHFSAYAQHYGLGALARPGWKYLRWFHNAGLRTYCPTQSVQEELQGHGFEQCAVWSRGVDVAQFSPRHRSVAFRTSVGATDDTLLVGYVGRLAAEKGMDVVLDTMHRVYALHGERVRFLVVGDGPLGESMRAAAPPCTSFTGELHGARLSEAFASLDVLLFPSTTDTFGNVMLEAMASGTPVIGADVGPTREQLSDGRGWLIEPGNAADMANIVTHLLIDPDARHAARELALAHAARRSWSAIWDALFTDYVTWHAPHAR